MFEIYLPKLVSIIERWEPITEYAKENEYRDELASHIRRQFKNDLISGDIKVSKESGRGLCDIAINERGCGIELKKDLKSKSQIDRLVGQVNRYQKEYNSVIIVLVGKTNPDSLDELKGQLKGIGSSLLPQPIKIIDKGNEKIKSNKKETHSRQRNPFDVRLF